MSRIQATMTVIHCHQNPSQLKKIGVINSNTLFRTDMHDTGATGRCVCVCVCVCVCEWERERPMEVTPVHLAW